jgi:FlgD Ig-like domain
MRFRRSWIVPARLILLANGLTITFAAALFATCWLSAEASQLNPKKPMPEPVPERISPPRNNPLPGETMETAIPIVFLPFNATGNTSDYEDDYAVMCPYGNWAPDVVYSFTSERETNISIRLCDSLYDTALFFYHTDDSVYHLVACNDDLCGIDGYRSAIEIANILPGRTYYIVVDGYTSASGDYILQVEDLGTCTPECTEIWELEGEQDCETDYEDWYNSGCDMYPQGPFRFIEPSAHMIRICGTSGWFYRESAPTTDSDWYEIQVEIPNPVDVLCKAEFDCSLKLVDGNGACINAEVLDEDEGQWCEGIASVSAELDIGTYWIVVDHESGMHTCGLGYRLWIDGYILDPMTVADQADVRGLLLHPPSPNPSSGAVEIRYTLPAAGPVSIDIYDVSGRLVRRLAEREASAGPGHVIWDGADDAGNEVVAGVYECRVMTDAGDLTRPFLRMR